MRICINRSFVNELAPNRNHSLLNHPTPKVRFNTAIALGRMNAQEHHAQLIEMLGPGESQPNVRLAARKALQALAGGVDRGYDTELWRREFERGDAGQ